MQVDLSIDGLTPKYDFCVKEPFLGPTVFEPIVIPTDVTRAYGVVIFVVGAIYKVGTQPGMPETFFEVGVSFPGTTEVCECVFHWVPSYVPNR